MKVLVITATYPPMPSGGSDYVYRLSRQLAQRQLDVEVVTTQYEGLSTDGGIPVHAIMEKWSWGEGARLLQIIKDVAPQVINLHFAGPLYNDHPMITFLPTITKKALPGVRFVTSFEAPLGVRAYLQPLPVRLCHKLVVKLTNGHFNYDFGSLLSESDWIIALSQNHLDAFEKIDHQVATKSTVLPAPPLMPILYNNLAGLRQQGRQKLGVSDDTCLLAYLGYVYPHKGIETLLQSFKTLLETRPNSKLAIIGGSPTILLQRMQCTNYGDEMRAMADQLGIADKVIWTGGFATDSTDPSLYLRASDIAVLPFDLGVHLNNSTFSAVAMHNLPIVTTRGENLEAPFKDEQNVLLCNPKDAAAMAKAIERLLDDATLRRQIADGALKLAQQMLTWDIVVDRTIDAFRGEAKVAAAT